MVLSFTMGIGSFPGAKRPGCGVNHLHPSTVEVKGKVDIYFYSQCVPSCQVTGCTLLLLSSLWNPRLGTVLLNTCRYTTAVSFCIPPDSPLINVVSHAKLNNFCCRQDSVRGHQSLKMEAASSSETSVTPYQQTVRNATEILDFNHKSRENLKSRSFSDIKAMFRRT